MKSIRNEAKPKIIEFIDAYYNDYFTVPTVREIAAGTGISVSTVHRCLNVMKENGELEYSGRRSISTPRTAMEGSYNAMPVLGYVACGPGQEEEEQLLEYIRMPETIVGNDECFALIAKGESMVDIGIYPGDYVFVRKQNTASVGDVVVALLDGKNNLKVLDYDSNTKQYVLKSCNADKETYEDKIVEGELQIQGVAVSVSHKLGKVKI